MEFGTSSEGGTGEGPNHQCGLGTFPEPACDLRLSSAGSPVRACAMLPELPNRWNRQRPLKP